MILQVVKTGRCLEWKATADCSPACKSWGLINHYSVTCVDGQRGSGGAPLSTEVTVVCLEGLVPYQKFFLEQATLRRVQ
jgi:hypothetical protein